MLSYQQNDKRTKLRVYGRSGCRQCPLQWKCTRSDKRTVTRHIYEAALRRSQARLKADPTLMIQRMVIAERPFAVLKQAMALRRFSSWGMKGARSDMAIGVLGYNLQQMINKLGVPRMLALLT